MEAEVACSKCKQTSPTAVFGFKYCRGRRKVGTVCNACLSTQRRAHYARSPQVRIKACQLEYNKRRTDPAGTLLNHAKVRARKLGLVLTIQKVDIVVPTHCPLLGLKLETGSGKVHDSSPSLDRIDSKLGYIPGNVHVISYKANRIKQDAELAELHRLTENLRIIMAKRGFRLGL